MSEWTSVGRAEWAAYFQRSLDHYLRAAEPGVAHRIDEMCAATGLDRSRVYAWRAGRSLPNAYAVVVMAEWFGEQYTNFNTDRLLGLLPALPTGGATGGEK